MTREKTKKKRDAEAAFPNFNGTTTNDLAGWPRGWAPRPPEPYYGGPGPYTNAYEWHTWPSQVRGDPTFPGDYAAFPRGTYPAPPFPGNVNIQTGAPLVPANTTTTTVLPTSPARASPHSSNMQNSESGKSQSEGSSFSATVDNAQDVNEAGTAQKHRKKRQLGGDKESRNKMCDIDAIKNGNFESLANSKNATVKETKGKQSALEESSAKNKRYGFEEIKDLVRFRTDLQAKFETMSTHLELWLSIGDKMSEKGHPKRAWESYRDKWDIELRRYQKELKNMLTQPGLGDNKELENPEQLVFTDDVLQEIHRRLNTRPKGALRSRFQSGTGGARGCLGGASAAAAAATATAGTAAGVGTAGIAEEGTREVAGKRMKKTANNQLLVDSIVDKVTEKIGSYEDTATAQGFKELLEAVLNLTNLLAAEVQVPQHYPEALEIDDKVFTWLKGIGKEQYASHFARAQVDWSTLMLLDKDDMVEMKVPLGPRKFILRELDKIRPEPLMAQQAADIAGNEHEVLEQEHEAEGVV